VKLVTERPDPEPTPSQVSVARPVAAESSLDATNVDLRLRAAGISLVVGTILLVAKFVAYEITGSTAILSDAMESIVNVVAALFTLVGLYVARWPADRNHPYGHGKVEFLSAAFEGGLITFAALMIVYQAVDAFFVGVTIRAADLGLLITLGAGLANATLGWFLVQTGKRHNSLALIADGRHVMSDFITSAGVTVALGLVLLTGLSWLDPAMAIAVGVQLAWTGMRLVGEAAGGLLDAEDPALLERIVAAINANLTPGIIRVHHLRAIRSGRFTHVDAHLVVPEFWSIEEAHDVSDAFEQRVFNALPIDGEIVFHVDPCHRIFCARCDVAPCPIRTAPFESKPPITLEEAVHPDPPQPEK
jgi:cation diffusion facilitator family transporter